MIKRLFLSISLILLFSASLPSVAADGFALFEQQFYQQTYADRPKQERVQRLEETVYGEAQSGGLDEREAKLLRQLQVLYPQVEVAQDKSPELPKTTAAPTSGIQNLAPLSGLPVIPESSYLPAQPPVQSPVQPTITTEEIPASHDATDYPVVTAMERKLFARDYVHEDVTHRLTRLEKKVFGSSYPSTALADRVDKLSDKLPGLYVPRGSSDPIPLATSSVLDSLPEHGSQLAGSGFGSYIQIDALEKSVFNRNYSGKLLTERLDQLERKLFGKTYTAESIDTRVNRLMDGYQRQYQAAPRQFSSNSGVQARPPVQPRPGSDSDYNAASSGNVQPGNVQIGADFRSLETGQSSGYSPELLNMLPSNMRSQSYTQAYPGYTRQGRIQAVMPGGNNVVRQRYQNQGPFGGYQSESTTTYTTQAPGGVVIQETLEYPGYGQAPYGAFSNTTPYGAFSNTTPYGGVYNAPFAQGYPQAGLYADPTVLNQLNQLETAKFGQATPNVPVYQRLNSLEASVLGQNYTGYSDFDRINNINRALQYQQLGGTLGSGKAGRIGRGIGSYLLGVPLNPGGRLW